MEERFDTTATRMLRGENNIKAVKRMVEVVSQAQLDKALSDPDIKEALELLEEKRVVHKENLGNMHIDSSMPD